MVCPDCATGIRPTRRVHGKCEMGEYQRRFPSRAKSRPGASTSAGGLAPWPATSEQNLRRVGPALQGRGRSQSPSANAQVASRVLLSVEQIAAVVIDG